MNQTEVKVDQKLDTVKYTKKNGEKRVWHNARVEAIGEDKKHIIIETEDDGFKSLLVSNIESIKA